MPWFEIPVPSNERAFRLRADLEGETYELEFSWNSRTSQYTLIVRDSVGTDLISTAVVGNSDLLTRFKNELLPPGNLVVFDSTGQQREPTLADFGKEFLVYYQEATGT